MSKKHRPIKGVFTANDGVTATLLSFSKERAIKVRWTASQSLSESIQGGASGGYLRCLLQAAAFISLEIRLFIS